MTEQQENRVFAKMLKEFPKAFGRVSFRERLMLRAAFDYVNGEVIADLKANFDYVLEGKNLEIKELKITDEYIIKTLESKVEKLQEDLRNKRISIKNKKAKIKELELELTVEKDQHQEEINLHLHAEEYIESLEKEIKELKHNKKTVVHLTGCLEEKMKERIEELEKQIEKMKCCFNCKHSRTEYEHCKTNKHEKWEIKEE